MINQLTRKTVFTKPVRFGENNKKDAPENAPVTERDELSLRGVGAVKAATPAARQDLSKNISSLDAMLTEPALEKKSPGQKTKQKKLSWIAKWMIATAGLGGLMAYTNQPPGPLDQVYLQSEEVRHQGKKMDWDAMAIENDVKVLQESLDQMDRFQNLGFRAEARQFFADAAKTYQQSATRLADIQASAPKSDQTFADLQKSIAKLSKADQEKVLRYFRESEWASKTMPEYWVKDSQQHLSKMNSAMGFSYNYTLNSDPMRVNTPQELANGIQSTLETMQDDAKQLAEELMTAQNAYNKVEEHFVYNRDHYWESQKQDYPNLPKHRPYEFGVDRYGDRVFHFERDLVKQEYKMNALAQRLAINEKAYQMLLERVKSTPNFDANLTAQLPKLEKGLTEIRRLSKEAQSQASGVRLKNVYHRLQSDSVENRPITLQAKQRFEELGEDWK
jgi:hypothetical protein